MPPPGFTMLDNDTVLDRLPEIDGTVLKVYLVLARHADASGVCWPSLDIISRKAGVSERMIRYDLRKLEQDGLIVADQRPGRATRYRLTPAIHCPPANGGRQPIALHPGNPLPPGGQPIAGGAATHCPQNKTQEQDTRTRHKNKTQEQDPGNKTQGTRPRARGKAAAGVQIPVELAGDVFKVAWDRWLTYRRDRKLTCTPATLDGQLRKLAALGPAGAAEEIDNSIANGWQSVCYKPGGNARGRKNGFPVGPGQRHSGSTAKPGVF